MNIKTVLSLVRELTLSLKKENIKDNLKMMFLMVKEQWYMMMVLFTEVNGLMDKCTAMEDLYGMIQNTIKETTAST